MQNSLKIADNNPRYHLLEDGTLRIVDANADLDGEYECMAQNVVGEAKSRPVRMAINYQSNLLPRSDDNNRPNKPKITLKPVGVTVSPTENIVLHCVADGEFDFISILEPNVMLTVLSNRTSRADNLVVFRQ